MTRLLGLYREAEFSPGRHRSNDALLLEAIAEALVERGLRVDLATIDQAIATRACEDAALVFSMCQGPVALDLLGQWSRDGVRVINHPEASLNTYRDRLPGLMRRAGVPFPETRYVPTRAMDPATVDVNGGLWLKRGDVHAAVSADVQWIDSAEKLQTALDEFSSRGVVRAALQQHQPGAEIKFYGVVDGRFFHWLYATNTDPASARPFDVGSLERMAEAAAVAAGLDIYGGDAIVGPSGELTLIDLNDWPSFAPCRLSASGAIADHLRHAVVTNHSAARAAL